MESGMGPVYTLAEFDIEHAVASYALVSLAYPRLTLKRWKIFVRAHASVGQARRRGMMGIRDDRGYWHAVFAFRLEPHLAGERLLRISDMVIGAIVGNDPVSLVMSAIDDLTYAHGCDAVVVDIAEWDGGHSDRESRKRFEKAGYRVNAVSLWRGA
jgi:hypothetical protein